MWKKWAWAAWNLLGLCQGWGPICGQVWSLPEGMPGRYPDQTLASSISPLSHLVLMEQGGPP